MPKRLDSTLTTEQADELRHALKYETRSDVRQRATAIRMLSQSHQLQAVAQGFDVSEVSIYNWWHRYQAEGMVGFRCVTVRFWCGFAAILAGFDGKYGVDWGMLVRQCSNTPHNPPHFIFGSGLWKWRARKFDDR